jgi:hypothetical protein
MSSNEFELARCCGGPSDLVDDSDAKRRLSYVERL